MLTVFSLLILALAVSLDGFGVGMMYGLRKIRIPLLSIAIISLCSGIIIYLSMNAGVWLSVYLSPDYARIAGALILVGIGIWALYQFLTQKQGQEEAEEGVALLSGHAVHAAAETQEPQQAGMPLEHPGETVTESTSASVYSPAHKMLSIEIKRLGLVIQILRTPSAADVDRSGNISSYEATLLGVALSLDAFGAGIGAALIGYTPLLTSAVIALASGIFIALGLSIGFRYSGKSWVRSVSVLPGCVLILMGILKLWS
ncbi:MntP/YtaF family protein [Paenibacillus sp. FJAT-26967]|uniref:MntP/YtaF family protein n=1 Tax=Paenibacillus sp. FJAT-26967 TaxID=1729690 RepID=UPI000838C964|nr:MntP/YtaF family protein [Paenibacillus sp. FJAT-26967]